MSALRWEALLDPIKTNLKRHCDTRWPSRHQPVTALQKNLPSVYEVLQHMTERRSMPPFRMSLQQPNRLDGQVTIQHMTDKANNWTTDTASGAMMLLR
ncbi:hypothetical protein AVEN_213811-1 [Araneus ventricosus]|uniref:Uncharacterized protein n=1 Tax=Araneus ventricosus TaxID=182803 RepID=A0A4Y2Q347_ARAVE|nr:hypothetical protein AVEN_148805-1 [Araneus ventricosus]GBN57573.1 hypothetical protein AVEN_213811-1 [Araneus ventricosus]